MHNLTLLNIEILPTGLVGLDILVLAIIPLEVN